MRLQFLVLLMMGAVTSETCRVVWQWINIRILLHLLDFYSHPYRSWFWTRKWQVCVSWIGTYFFHKNATWIERLGDTDMGEMIILKRILKAIWCEGVECIDVAGNTLNLWTLINPTINFAVLRKTVGPSVITQSINFLFREASPFLCL